MQTAAGGGLSVMEGGLFIPVGRVFRICGLGGGQVRRPNAADKEAKRHRWPEKAGGRDIFQPRTVRGKSRLPRSSASVSRKEENLEKIHARTQPFRAIGRKDPYNAQQGGVFIKILNRKEGGRKVGP